VYLLPQFDPIPVSALTSVDVWAMFATMIR
jgi:hypothetical protein